MDYTDYKQVYLCGDMLHKGLAEYRKQQKDIIEGIENLEVYNPSSNSEINDKSNASTYKLAEKIVEHDSTAIDNADIYVIDLPTADAGGRGTVAEIGQIYQAKRQARNNIKRLENHAESTKYDFEGNITESYHHLQYEIEEQQKILNKVCLVYSDDIRFRTSDMNEHMDRIPYSFNAYTYGLVMSITNGKGVLSWEEVLQELEKLGQEQ